MIKGFHIHRLQWNLSEFLLETSYKAIIAECSITALRELGEEVAN